MKKIIIKLSSIATLALPMCAISCHNNGKQNDININKDQKDKENTNKENPVENKTNEADKFGDETEGLIQLINSNVKYFNEACSNIKDYVFIYARNNKTIYAYKSTNAGGSQIDWKNLNEEYAIAKINDTNYSSNYQLANNQNPIKNDKINNFLNVSVDADKNVILTYKTAIFGNNIVVSTKEFKVTLGKILDDQSLKKVELLNEKTKEVSFDYKDKANTYVKDANLDLIIKNIPSGYSLSKYKAVINEETNDITIIFKIKKDGTNIENEKNQSYVITGWKKTQAMIDKENEAINKLNEELNKVIVQYLDEKAYVFVQKNKAILNYENKPNFVVSGYDESLYSMKLSDLNVDKNEIKVKLIVKNNESVKNSKVITISKEFKTGINPHSMTEDEQKTYLENSLKDNVIYPYYSKDKTYIERLETDKLNDKSYFIKTKNNSLEYVYSKLRKDGDKYFVNVEVSFKDWPESIKVNKDLEIDLSIKGLDIINEARIKRNQEPLQDQFAPSSTLDPEYKATFDLSKFVETPQDEYLTNDLAAKIVQEKLIKSLKDKQLSLMNEEIAKEIIKQGDKFIAAQLYDPKFKDKPEYKLYAFVNAICFTEKQQFMVFSKPEIVDNKIISIKVSFVSIQNANANDFSAVSSTRVKVSEVYNGEALFQKYLLTNALKNEVVLEVSNKNLKPSEVKKEDIIIKQKPEGYNLEIVELKPYDSKKKLTVYIVLKNADGSKETFKFAKSITGFQK